MGMTGEVVGAERLRVTLDQAADQLPDLDSVDHQVEQLVLADIHPPRRSGALASTVAAVTEDDGVTFTAGSPDVQYAGVIHNGWPGHHITAQPFITDAIDRDVDAIADRYEDHVTEALSHVQGA